MSFAAGTIVNDGLKLLVDYGIFGWTESDAYKWQVVLLSDSVSTGTFVDATTEWSDISGNTLSPRVDLTQATWQNSYVASPTRKGRAVYGSGGTPTQVTLTANTTDNARGYAIVLNDDGDLTLIALGRFSVDVGVANGTEIDVSPVLCFTDCEECSYALDAFSEVIFRKGIRNEDTLTSDYNYTLIFIKNFNFDFCDDDPTDGANTIAAMGDYDLTEFGPLSQSYAGGLNTDWTAPAVDADNRVYTEHANGFDLENDSGGNVTIYGTVIAIHTVDGDAITPLAYDEFESPVVLLDGATATFPFRFVLGECPGPGDPADWLTLLLLHCNGVDETNTFTDSSFFARTVTAQDGAEISTDEFKFGAASGLFDDAGSDRLEFANASEFAIGTGDFTIDFWVKATTTLDDVLFADARSGIGDMVVTTGGTSSSTTVGVLRYAAGYTGTGLGQIVSTTRIDDNNWHHCAVVRYSGTTKLYVNGIEEASMSDSLNYAGSSGTWYISANSYDLTVGNHSGYLDEFRISRVARWTANFTPPAAAYSPD